MINKQLKIYRHLLVAIFISIASSSAFALSLGEMTVHSHFAEPFRAEIALPSYNPDETSSIDIHLASAAQHETMGYAFSDTTQQFQFALKENNEGALYIDVRSKLSIKELSISILIEVTSVNGRIIKGYDILLTPKAISDVWQQEKIEQPFQLKLSKINRASNDTQPPSTTLNKPSSPVAVQESRSKATKKNTSRVKHNSDGSIVYTEVSNGETLSLIAQRMRPNKSLHMKQVMVALYKENPRAFLNNNINLLKTGVSLQLTDIAAIDDISPFQAQKLINQYAHPLKSHPQQSKNKTLTAANKNETPAEPATKKMENRLQISSDEEFLTAEVLEAFHQETLSNVESELNNAHEAIKSLDIKNKELLERIAYLEDEINQTTKAIFSPSHQKDTGNIHLANVANTNNANDALVINTQVNTNQESDSSLLSLLKQNQMPLSFAFAGLLAIALIATRKKQDIIALIHKFKKPKTATPDYFDLK